jgi:sortase (surface protein transpeptidase)
VIASDRSSRESHPLTGGPKALGPRRRVLSAFATAVLIVSVTGAATAVSSRATMPTSAARPAAVTTGAPSSLITDALASRVAPLRIRIPAIGVNAPLMRLGLTRSHALAVPPNASTAGWYTGGPMPGRIGPAVIAAHVHWNGQPGAFARLAQLKTGDLIRVTRSHATDAVFTVTRVAVFRKSAFPTKLVYGSIPYAGLRLITCDGFRPSSHTYLDNLVVFARLAPSVANPA